MSTMSPVVKSSAGQQRRKIRPYGFIEATHRKQFDDLARLAALICRTPMALIALAENNRHRIVAQIGLDAATLERDETFCRRVTESHDLTMTDQPFMAGVPLLGFDGRTMGCLCVMDVAARPALDPEQIDGLWSLSRQVLAQVELRRSLTKLARACAGQSLAEQELAKERNLLRSLIDNLPENIYLKDVEGRYLLDNRAHVRFLGARGSADVAGKTVFDFFPPEQAEKFDADDKTVLRWGQALLNLEEVAVDQGGMRHDLLTSKIPLRDEHSAVVGLICVSHDITGRKQAERAVSQLAAIVEDSSDSIYSKNLDDVVLTWNAAAERMYGYSAAEIVGRHIGMLYPSNRLGEAQRIHEQIAQGRRVATFDSERLRKDGSRIDVSVTISPLRDGGGKVIGASVVARDITERKRAARALRESEERFRLMVEGVKDYAIVMLHARGHITGWNPGAERIFGYPAQEVLGESVTRFFRPEEIAAGAPTRELAEAESHGRAETEGWRVRNNGTHFYAHVITTALRDEDGQICWFAQITQDITELKQKTIELEDSNRLLVQTLDQLHRTQQELIQTERLRALGQMATGIAHDFNNALAPIIGFSELLMVRPDDLKDTERVARYLGLIHANAESAVQIVNRLRDFYRYRDGNEVLTPVDLNRVIEQVVELTRPKWQNEALAQGVTIEVANNPSAIAPVMGQEAELVDALTGVVLNAIDAVLRKKQSGRISLSTRQESEHVAVVVQDTGAGMSAEVRQHCFEPFFSTKTAHGSGLGLALVYGVVNRHAGMITLEGEEGQGTTVTLRFPAQVVQAPVVPKKVKPAKKSGTMRILVVDDDPGVREVTVEYLREDKHQLDQAASGQEALEKLQAGDYDMVITDKAMPGMSGCQLATAIKQTYPEMPVLLVTGYGEMMNAAGEKPADVDLVLGKPLSIEELLKAVAQFSSATGTACDKI